MPLRKMSQTDTRTTIFASRAVKKLATEFNRNVNPRGRLMGST